MIDVPRIYYCNKWLLSSRRKHPTLKNKKIKSRKKSSFSEQDLSKEHTVSSQPKPKSAPFKKADNLKLRFIPSLPPRTADSTPVRLLKIKISQGKGAEKSLEIRAFEVYCTAFISLPSGGCKALHHLGFGFIHCISSVNTQTFASCETSQAGAWSWEFPRVDQFLSTKWSLSSCPWWRPFCAAVGREHLSRDLQREVLHLSVSAATGVSLNQWQGWSLTAELWHRESSKWITPAPGPLLWAPHPMWKSQVGSGHGLQLFQPPSCRWIHPLVMGWVDPGEDP